MCSWRLHVRGKQDSLTQFSSCLVQEEFANRLPHVCSTDSAPLLRRPAEPERKLYQLIWGSRVLFLYSDSAGRECR